MVSPENELERALLQAAQNPDDRPAFYRELLEADIYVLSADQPVPGSANELLNKGTEIRFKYYEAQGARYLPIFSSLKRLQAGIKAQASYFKFKGKAFFEMTRGERILLNPGSEVAKGFTVKEISDLLDGSIFLPRGRYRLDDKTEVWVGQASDYPAELVKALSDLFTSQSLVRAAYLVLASNPSTGDSPRYIVGIDVEGDWDSILAEVKQAAAQVEAPGIPVDYIQISDIPLCRYMTDQTEPIYVRDPGLTKGVRK